MVSQVLAISCASSISWPSRRPDNIRHPERNVPFENRARLFGSGCCLLHGEVGKHLHYLGPAFISGLEIRMLMRLHIQMHGVEFFRHPQQLLDEAFEFFHIPLKTGAVRFNPSVIPGQRRNPHSHAARLFDKRTHIRKACFCTVVVSHSIDAQIDFAHHIVLQKAQQLTRIPDGVDLPPPDSQRIGILLRAGSGRWFPFRPVPAMKSRRGGAVLDAEETSDTGFSVEQPASGKPPDRHRQG